MSQVTRLYGWTPQEWATAEHFYNVAHQAEAVCVDFGEIVNAEIPAHVLHTAQKVRQFWIEHRHEQPTHPVPVVVHYHAQTLARKYRAAT